MVTLRPYRPDDAPALLALFRDTVRRVNRRDYSPEQIAAWASDDIDTVRWFGRFEGRFVPVAEEAGRPVGFAELEPTGHVDRVYVSADHQRCGIGRRLLAATIAEARRVGLTRLYTEASITARPFFEAQGFTVLAPQVVTCRGAEFLNYRMERVLGEPPAAPDRPGGSQFVRGATMRMVVRAFGLGLLVAGVLAVLSAAGGCTRRDAPAPAAGGADRPWPPALLKDAGFVEVPLAVGKGRLFEVDVEIGGEKFLFLIDTGASYLVLERTVADRLKLPTKKAPGPVGGLGTADAPTRVTRLDSLRVGGFASAPFEAWVMDLSAINAARAGAGDRPCDGLIGAAFLDYHQAVLDYPARKLYLRPRPEGAPGP